MERSVQGEDYELRLKKNENGSYATLITQNRILTLDWNESLEEAIAALHHEFEVEKYKQRIIERFPAESAELLENELEEIAEYMVTYREKNGTDSMKMPDEKMFFDRPATFEETLLLEQIENAIDASKEEFLDEEFHLEGER